MRGEGESEPLIMAAASPAPSYRTNPDYQDEEDLQSLSPDDSMWNRSVRFVTDHVSMALVHKTIGVVMVMCAGFSFTSSNVMQKFSVKEVTFWQLLAVRAVIQFVGLGALCVYKHLRHGAEGGWARMLLGPRGVRRRTVLQGMLGGVLLACMFVAVKFVPLGNASAIIFCTPIFTFFMAPCMLSGERLGLYRMLIATLMFLGVLFITRPNSIFGPPVPSTNLTKVHSFIMPDETLPGVQYLQEVPSLPLPSPRHNLTVYASVSWVGVPAVSGGRYHQEPTSGPELVAGYICCVVVPLLSAFISLVTRQCNLAKVPVYVLMFWFGVGAVVIVAIATAAMNTFDTIFNLTAHQFAIVGVITALGMFGNMAYTIAVRFVSPTLANVFRSFEVILNFVLQVHLEKIPYYNINIIGICLLVIAVVVMSYENTAKSKWKDSFKYL